MDLVSGYKIQVPTNIVYVERLLDCTNNGNLAEDRRNAMAELQSIVAERFPVLFGVLKEHDHVEMEAILTIPRGITRLVDMLMDREVLRNEALLLLTYLTHEAEEIQKKLVFEGAFEKIFGIINEEGGSNGGVAVQF